MCINGISSVFWYDDSHSRKLTNILFSIQFFLFCLYASPIYIYICCGAHTYPFIATGHIGNLSSYYCDNYYLYDYSSVKHLSGYLQRHVNQYFKLFQVTFYILMLFILVHNIYVAVELLTTKDICTLEHNTN